MNSMPIAEELLEEYPVLGNWMIRFVRQFPADPIRMSNAFLVTCESPSAPVERFVAKRVPNHITDPTAIRAEWRALRLALSHGIFCPPLIFPQREPDTYLLLGYLEGIDAETCIEQGAQPSAVFAALGACLREVHAVPAPRFGDLASGSGSWRDWIVGRIGPRLADIRPMIGEDLHRRASEDVRNLIAALDYERDEPRLMHRDVYLSNFLIDGGKTHILDFGMAQGGRPLYDLAKLFVLDLWRFPGTLQPFLSAYFGPDEPPTGFPDLMALYLYAELVGMIRFFQAQGQREALGLTMEVFTALVRRHSRIMDLIEYTSL